MAGVSIKARLARGSSLPTRKQPFDRRVAATERIQCVYTKARRQLVSLAFIFFLPLLDLSFFLLFGAGQPTEASEVSHFLV